MVGIKGAGMAGLAQILKGLGYGVQGSDTREKFYTDAILKRLRIPVVERFSPKNIRDADLVIASNAYIQGTGNPSTQLRASRDRGSGYSEVREARRRKIPVLSYPEAVGELFNTPFGIAVAGTHGKSTTAAMISVLLEKLGADPTALIGAEVLNWHSNARISRPTNYQLPTTNYFVLEADEYKNAFLHYLPNMIVLTNVEWDHPDVFPNLAKYAWAFKKFMHNLKQKGTIIVSRDNNIAWRVAQQKKNNIISFGRHAHSTVRIKDVVVRPAGTTCSVFFKKKRLGRVTLTLWGEHQAHNAAAAIACGLALGFPFPRIKKALAAFQGTRRRFELLKAQNYADYTQTNADSPRKSALSPRESAVIIDDYAHHPTEIRVTIETARKAFPGRPIHVLFQPHTFSRTKALFGNFLKALKTADAVYLLSTYGSARERKGKVGSEALAKALGAPYFKNHAQAIAALRKTLPARAVFLALGAGDQRRVAEAVRTVVL